MSITSFATPSLILIFVGVMTIFLSRNWKWGISSLGIMYLGVFGLISLSWPINLAIVKLITGWLASSVLAITQILSTRQDKRISQPTSEFIFWTFSAILVIIISYSLSSSLLIWLPIFEIQQSLGGIFLMGIGLLSLGFSNQGFRVSMSLLIMLAGFEILYATVEASVLVAGLLAVVNLGIALSGAYLIVSRIEENKKL